MPTAGNVLLTKSSLTSGATAADHLNSIVVGSIIGSPSVFEAVYALPVEIPEAEVTSVTVQNAEVDIVNPEPAVAVIDQEPVTAIILPVEAQVDKCL